MLTLSSILRKISPAIRKAPPRRVFAPRKGDSPQMLLTWLAVAEDDAEVAEVTEIGDDAYPYWAPFLQSAYDDAVLAANARVRGRR